MNPKNRLAPFAAAAVVLIASAGSASASVVGVGWKSISPTQAELYAITDAADTLVVAAELITTPVTGAPSGLYSTGGAILPSSNLFMGMNPPALVLTGLTITPTADGSVLEARWAAENGIAGMLTDLDEGLFLAVRLLRIDVEPGTLIGGGESEIKISQSVAGGQPASFHFSIPEVPAAPTGVLAAIALASASRRRR